MNFKSFITESVNPMADEITSNCQQYLKEIVVKKSPTGWNPSQMPLLYRGFTSDKGPMAKITPRTDRKPRDTKKYEHDAFNAAFEKLYGVKDIRSRAVFCTGHFQDAKYYGSVYVIFPVDGYTYWWNESIADLGPELAQMDEPTPDEIYDWLKVPVREYNHTDLRTGIHSGNEIMLLCKEYYAVHYENVAVLDYIKRKALEL